jgi:hypothetical protein
VHCQRLWRDEPRALAVAQLTIPHSTSNQLTSLYIVQTLTASIHSNNTGGLVPLFENPQCMPCMEFCADMPRPDSFGPQTPPEEWGCDSPCHDIVDPLLNCFDPDCFNQPPEVDWIQTCEQTDGCLFTWQAYSCVPDTPTNRCHAIQDEDTCARDPSCTFNYDVSVRTKRPPRNLSSPLLSHTS